MKKYENGQYIDMTEEEIAETIAEQKRWQAQEKHRPLTLDEVNTMLIKKQINTIEIDDQTSVRMLSYYPTYADVIGQTVQQGFKLTYEDKLYKVIQPTLVISDTFIPGATGTESLFERIDEKHDGDLYDPIPYSGNMALQEDLCYTQDNVTYVCIRSTGTAVYANLADLVGQFVEVV